MILLAAACSPVCLAQASGVAIPPPANQRPVLTVTGQGSQIYVCQQNGKSYQWVFYAPVARLFNGAGREVGTHGDGPTWNYEDGSSIQGSVIKQQPSPNAGSVPELLLKGINPRNAGLLSTVEYISRSNTQGGAAPTTGCDADHQGQLNRVPYTATYTFYTSKPASPAAR